MVELQLTEFRVKKMLTCSKGYLSNKSLMVLFEVVLTSLKTNFNLTRAREVSLTLSTILMHRLLSTQLTLGEDFNIASILLLLIR